MATLRFRRNANVTRFWFHCLLTQHWRPGDDAQEMKHTLAFSACTGLRYRTGSAIWTLAIFNSTYLLGLRRKSGAKWQVTPLNVLFKKKTWADCGVRPRRVSVVIIVSCRTQYIKWRSNADVRDDNSTIAAMSQPTDRPLRCTKNIVDAELK